jgi:hypothetical protein
MKFIPMTGGDGDTGQDGLEILTILNKSLTGLIGNIAAVELAEESFDWSADLTAYENNTLVITHDHDLEGANITLPAGVILLFNGGRLLNVGNLVGNGTEIRNPLNKPCFNLVVTFTGNWVNTITTPQWFGAVCTANPNTLPGAMVVGGNVSLNQRNEGGATSSSPAIQKVFDSPFQPHFPNGYYYITEPVTISRQVVVDFGIPVKEMIDELSTFHYKNDHVRFYTDQNTGFWKYQKHGIYLIGGVMDIRNAVPYNSPVYHMKADVPCWGGEASGDVVGSEAGARVEGGTGKYFWWDTTDTSVYGYITKFRILTHSLYINYGIIIDNPADGGVNCWANGFHIDAYFDGSKQSININDSGGGYVSVTAQTRDILHESERYTYQKVINSYGNTLDGFTWDVNVNPFEGYYRTHPGYECQISKGGTKLQGTAIGAAYQVTDPSFEPQSIVSITHKSRITLLQGAALTPVFISDIHNALPILANNGLSTIGAFEGATIDFDTEFRDAATLALPVAANVSITNPTSVLKGEGKTTYAFAAGATVATDFVEIHTPFSEQQLNRLFLHINEDYCAIRRIQIIKKNTSNDYVLVKEIFPAQANSYRINTYEIDLGDNWYRGLLIRFVGVLTQAGLVRVLDYGVKQSTHIQTFVPKINDYRYKYSAVISQVGAAAPTLAQKLNTFPTSPAFSAYSSPGDFTLTHTGYVTLDKMDITDITLNIYQGLTFIGTIWILRTSNDTWRIRTYNPDGELADGIINGFRLNYNFAW